MGISVIIKTFLVGLMLGVHQVLATDPYGCHANNCYRDVAATRFGLSFEAQATLDCQSFLGKVTVTLPAVTITTVSVVNITITTNGKRNVAVMTPPPVRATKTIPSYAGDCQNSAQYSSACSCMGISTGITTIRGSTVTVVSKSTRTVTSTTSTTTNPSCTANITTDPLNCGKCGNVCSTGVCDNGTCSSNQCASNQTCANGFRTCGGGTANCFCFSDYLGAGFCGQNIVCSVATECKDNKDCTSGSICATNTCCPPPSQTKPGICLVGECANPTNKLIRMAAMRRNYVGGDTAAWEGFGEA